jgi:hypothetical protein
MPTVELIIWVLGVGNGVGNKKYAFLKMERETGFEPATLSLEG